MFVRRIIFMFITLLVACCTPASAFDPYGVLGFMWGDGVAKVHEQATRRQLQYRLEARYADDLTFRLYRGRVLEHAADVKVVFYKNRLSQIEVEFPGNELVYFVLYDNHRQMFGRASRYFNADYWMTGDTDILLDIKADDTTRMKYHNIAALRESRLQMLGVDQRLSAYY